MTQSVTSRICSLNRLFFFTWVLKNILEQPLKTKPRERSLQEFWKNPLRNRKKYCINPERNPGKDPWWNNLIIWVNIIEEIPREIPKNILEVINLAIQKKCKRNSKRNPCKNPKGIWWEIYRSNWKLINVWILARIPGEIAERIPGKKIRRIP